MKNLPDRLVLFDVDKTLLTRNQAHERVFEMAYAQVCSFVPEPHLFATSGMTDSAIMRKTLIMSGFSQAQVDSFQERFFAFMIKAFPHELKKTPVAVLPGARNALKNLAKQHYLLGLVTGNLEPIAWHKMASVHLKQYLSLGGFGSDHQVRSELVKIAIERAKLNFGFIGEQVYVVGDTPKDIAAGKAIKGVETIGVTTGRFDRVALTKAGADLVVKNLRDPKLFKYLSS